MSTPPDACRRPDVEETLAIRAQHCHLSTHADACRRLLAPSPGYHVVTTERGAFVPMCRFLTPPRKEILMTTSSLTDRSLRALTRPKPAPVAIFDTDVRQLQVRASVTGTVSFSVLKRPPGSRKLARFPVGSYPLITLAEARTKARAILREIEGGVDPRKRELEETRLAVVEQERTFAAVAE